MKVLKTVKEIDEMLCSARKNGLSVGFVPTMGALHEGHASLVRRCVKENDVTVVSDFVNPTQFNDKGDLQRYPRTFEADFALLDSIGADYMFFPSVEEIYPEPDTRVFSYPPIDTVMEGARRPGHFNGVCQVVSRLFSIIKPQKAYFGEKDFQQIAVIKAMVKDCKFNIEICPCPVVRQEDGLAKSSRNALLSDDERKLATHIYESMHLSLDYAKSHSVAETQEFVVNRVNSFVGLNVEYYEIVNASTLQDITDWNDTDSVVGCITVFCGKVPIRLIDHIRYK